MPQTAETTPDNALTLALIDKTISDTTQAAHCCSNPLAKELLEYALALVTECWIAESGQPARDPHIIIAEVKSTDDLFTAVFGKEGQ